MKTLSPKEKLQFLLDYYNKNRRVGHTELLWSGANAAHCLILTLDDKVYQSITKNRGPFTQGVTLNSLDLMEGRNLPVAWDNSGVVALLTESLREIDRLEKLSAGTMPEAETGKDKEIVKLKKINQNLVQVLETLNGSIDREIKMAKIGGE